MLCIEVALNFVIFIIEYKKEHMRFNWKTLSLIFYLCVNHYTRTSFKNLSPLLLQCSVQHLGFQNDDLYHTVYNLKHIVLISVMIEAQILLYQDFKELLHVLTAFVNFRIALNECRAREEIGKLWYSFQPNQLLNTLHIFPLFQQLCNFLNSQIDQ